MMGDVSDGAQEHTPSENGLMFKMNDPRKGCISVSHEPTLYNYVVSPKCRVAISYDLHLIPKPILTRYSIFGRHHPTTP